MPKQFTCDECGSTDLEAEALVNVNTCEFIGWSGSEHNECYCNDCGKYSTHTHSEVIQVECPNCGHEGWWNKDNTKLAYCKCGKVMVIVEEPCIS